MKLSEELEIFRSDRPSEWKMDEFISKAKELEKYEQWLDALEEAGVNNWEGYELAQDILNDRNSQCVVS